MVAFKVYTGICKDGPLNGKVQTRESRRLEVPGHGGAYFYVPPSGATPGAWRWAEKKGVNVTNQ